MFQVPLFARLRAVSKVELLKRDTSEKPFLVKFFRVLKQIL
jgi:hypothetical protein